MVNLQAGQNSTYFDLQTENDDEPEDDEHIQVLIKDGSEYSVAEAPNHSAIIRVSDILDHNRISDSMTEAYNEIIPIMLNSIGTRSLETLTTRSNLAFTNNNSNQFELNGISELPEIISQIGMTTNQGSQSLTEMFRNSSFSFGLQPDTILTNNATIWGINEHKEISSANSNYLKNWDGEYTTHQFGFESVISQSVLAGLTASFSNTQIDYGIADEIHLNFADTSFQSYFGYVPNDQSSEFQITTGYGKLKSDIEHTSQIGKVIENDYLTLAVAGQKSLFGIGNISEIGLFELAMKGQYWNAQIINSNGSHFHKNKEINSHELLLAPEGTYRVVLPNSAEISNVASIEVGSNSNSTRTDYFMDYRDYLSFSHPIGFSATADGQILTDQSNQISDLSLTTQFQIDFGFDGLGTQIAVESQIGQYSKENTSRVFAAFDNSNYRVSRPQINGTRVESTIGYGFELGDTDWLMTPTSSIEFSESSFSGLNFGNSVKLGTIAELSLDGGIEYESSGIVSRELQMHGRIHW